MKQTRLRFFVGVNTGYVVNGEPDARYVEFYSRRSSPLLYCAIIGNVVIPGGYGSNSNTAGISRSKIWSIVADGIRSRGSRPGVQLATTWVGYKGARSFRSPSANEFIERARLLVLELGSVGISAVLSSFENGAEMALEAGFEHVQVHAAHGYLFNLLVDDRIYEGAQEIRSRLADWSLRIRRLGGETSIRISLKSGDRVFDSVRREEFQNSIASMPFDFIDLSSGFYEVDKQLIYPARPDTLHERRQETLALAARYPETNFIYSGRALLQSEDELPSNVHIGLCRDLLANPDYLVGGRVRCMNSGKCHYYSRGTDHITCGQWQAFPE